MFAIVSDRNKQYSLSEGSILKIDNINLNPGDKYVLDNVLVLINNDVTIVGDPFIKHAKVEFLVLKPVKDDKVVTLKFRRRKHYMNKCGHRQKYLLVKVMSILLSNG